MGEEQARRRARLVGTRDWRGRTDREEEVEREREREVALPRLREAIAPARRHRAPRLARLLLDG